MLAFSLMTFFLTSAIVLSASLSELRKTALGKLEDVEYASQHLSSSTLISQRKFGNDSVIKSIEPFSWSMSDYKNAMGRGSCNINLRFDWQKTQVIQPPIHLGTGNKSTDIEVRNGIVYITSDSNVGSAHDFFIIDVRNPYSPQTVSSLNTGPGLAALEVAGNYVYTANLGTTHQLQIIDISDRNAPILASTLKLPLPRASSTPPRATALFYKNGHVYLGTEKWEGNEFSVIDVNDPHNPQFIGGFKTDTQINSIYINVNEAYVAASDKNQLRVLDVTNPGSMYLIKDFSPSGWETQVGKFITFFEDEYFLGRTTGGFNVVSNHELFALSTSNDEHNSQDIPGGVYGIIERADYIYLATKLLNKEFQIWTSDLTQKIFDYSLGSQPVALACHENTFYFATGDEKGVLILNNT